MTFLESVRRLVDELNKGVAAGLITYEATIALSVVNRELLAEEKKERERKARGDMDGSHGD